MLADFYIPRLKNHLGGQILDRNVFFANLYEVDGQVAQKHSGKYTAEQNSFFFVDEKPK